MNAQELREKLKSIGWSQADFAARIKVDYDTVNRWANGRTDVPSYAAEYLRVMALAKEIVNDDVGR